MHSDVLGSINPVTVDNKHYIVSFIDDFNNFEIVYLIENKNEVVKYFIDYHAHVTAFHQVKISTIRCDNGEDYASTNF